MPSDPVIDVDPITLAVVAGTLESAVREMSITMRRVGRAIGLGIAAFGTTGLVQPDVLAWAAGLFTSSTAWLTLAVIRLSVGATLVTAAPASRFPRGLKVVGFVILGLAALTLTTGLFGVRWASDEIQQWLAYGRTAMRLTAVPIIALGAFLAYACGPREAGDR